MFELAIGALVRSDVSRNQIHTDLHSKTNSETSLFKRFERYSTLAAKWLKYHDPSSPLYDAAKHEHYQAEDFDHGDEEEQSDDEEVDEEKRSTQFVNRLLNVAKEAKLLVECKDIQEELEILTSVLEQQMNILSDMHKVFRQCVVDEEKRGPLILKIGQQKELVSLHILDIQRMDKQARTVNANLLQVLDLKQKHANALEARFQRDQAQATAKQALITAKQGQILMSFTIVTIFFLPMSFMASFFTINVIEFPHDPSNGGNGIPLSYVSKYIFGIGFGISIPLIAVAFLFSDIKGWIKTLQKWLKKESPKQEKHPPPVAKAAPDDSPTQIMDFAEKSRPSSDSFRPSIFTRHGTGRTDLTNRSRETDEEMGR
jgi:Mg2+ and Co2+ transporter CorA